MSQFTSFMDAALEEAIKAAARGEVPVGAIITLNGEIIAKAGNRTRELKDPTAHAEILAIRSACKTLDSERLQDCDLWVTLEPCPACAATISAARLKRLYIGAPDPKSGGIAQGPRIFDHPQAHHKPEVYTGLQEVQSAALLHEFFSAKR